MSDTDLFPEPRNRGRLRDKWDYVIDPGFAAVPYVLLFHQHALRLTSEHLNVLLNVLAHWHANGRMAFPHSHTIAKRMGISQRSVQRSLSWLIKNEFITKAERKAGESPKGYDPKPLVEKLKPYAWARMQLTLDNRHPEILSDDVIAGLVYEQDRMSAQEMFANPTRTTADEL
ncbi:helix-turn-helix domain-containing protein [Bradyrhizobium sp. 197]|uniref:helix-turn-helix domain-containing protein n=1 Tax=Bradyrhizobium sp. 197 TaxID=2782663 RepID=UPI001FFA0068|nr:helix-turn-helix domain-containing protein [Bradyrhizobium sp. 197]MCK1478053.1 helix-turn-helix domain-containing protein [Bradyrhizobium sp. 197]